jgi:large subunit ribosomal protein L24
MHVKKGDTVLVLSGNDKGRTGEVKEALPSTGRVVVTGVNLRWRHRRPSQKNPKGERVQREVSIHSSNVRRVEAASAKGSKAKGSKQAKSDKAAKADKPAKGAAKSRKAE